MFPLAPPPPAFSLDGALPRVAAAFSAHVAAEERRSWVAPSSALRLDDAGRLAALHYPAAALEEGGLRALLVYYNDRFPRATPVFSLLSAPTAALVFAELFDASDARLVKVSERTTTWRDGRTGAGTEWGRRVYAVTSPSYATDYDVAGVVRDVAAILDGAEVPCSLTYDPGALDAVLVLRFEDFDARIDITDRYGEEVARARVLTKDGADLGDPAPTVKRRKSSANGAAAGLTIADGIATRLAAAPDHFHRATARASK